jgi:hypothetical protein
MRTKIGLCLIIKSKYVLFDFDDDDDLRSALFSFRFRFFLFFLFQRKFTWFCVFSYQFWIDMVWVRFRNIIFLVINTLVLTPNWDLTSTLSICPISWAKDFALGFCPERSSTFWIVSHFYFSDSFVVGDVFSVTRKKGIIETMLLSCNF